MSAKMERGIPKQKRILSMSGNNKGLACPLRPIICQEGYCCECQIYSDWRMKGSSLNRKASKV